MKKILTFTLILAAFISKADYWTQKATFPGIRISATSFNIGNKGYVTCGFNVAFGYSNDLWEYDPLTNVWTQKANFGGSIRAFGMGFSILNKGYAGLGGLGGIGSQDFWEYDPLTDVWTQKANFGGGIRSLAAGFSVGNKGYAGLGFYQIGSNEYLFNDFWEYDPILNVWTQKSYFPSIRRACPINFSIGNKGYVGCGFDSVENLYDDFWEYDVISDSWSQKATFPGGGITDAASFSIGNFGYTGTGEGPVFSFHYDFWQYLPITNQWIQKANFPGAQRDETIYFSVNNKGYIGYGASHLGTTITYQDFYEYTPDSTTDIQELRQRNLLVKISPNPFSDKLKIEVENSETLEIILFDFTSKLINHQKFTNSVTLNTEQLTKGIYLYEVSNKSGVIKKGKIVKD